MSSSIAVMPLQLLQSRQRCTVFSRWRP